VVARAGLLALALAACGERPAEGPSREEAEAALLAGAVEAPPPAPPLEDGALVQVEVTWSGVGELYRQFFTDQEAMTALSRRLAPHVAEPAQLRIHYDSERFTGGIRMVVPPGGWVAAPTAEGGAVDLQALAPVTTALAVYRDDLASRYDLRIQSLFSIGVDLYRGPVHCAVGPAGDPPPDGRTVSPCVEVNGQEVCGMPAAGRVAFQPSDWKRLAACFTK